jgi:hypothetical protein
MLRFGNGTNGNLGKFFKILKQKMYEMGKKIVSLSNLLLLRQGIFLCRDVLKGQHVMLIKWENFGAFVSRLLRREIFLTGDSLNGFYSISKSHLLQKISHTEIF